MSEVEKSDDRGSAEREREGLLRSQLIKAVRGLDEAPFNLAATRIRRDSKLRGRLTNTLGRQPVPPILRHALRSRDAGPVAISLGSALNEHLVREFSIDESEGATLRSLIDGGTQVKDTHGTVACRVWLLFLSLVGGPLDPLVEAILQADGPWHATGYSQHSKLVAADATCVTEVAAMMADGVASGSDYADVTVEQLRASLNAVIDDSADPEDYAVARWLIGSTLNEFAEDFTDVRGERFQVPTNVLPELPDWPGQPPVDPDDDELTRIMAGLLADAADAAAQAHQTLVQDRRAPSEQQIARLWRASTAARQLEAAAGHGGPPEELAAELEAARSPTVALRRLAEVRGAAGAEEAAEQLREAAEQALMHDEAPAGLVQLAALLDASTRPPLEDIQQLLSQVPATLHGALLAASHGLLELPANGPAFPPTVEVAAQEQQRERPDRELTDEPTTELTEPSSEESADNAQQPIEPEGEPSAAEEDTSGAIRQEVGAGSGLGTQESEPKTRPPEEPAGAARAPEITKAAQPPRDTETESAQPQLSETGRDADAETNESVAAAQREAREELHAASVNRLLQQLLGDRHDPAAAYWVATVGDADSALQAATETLTYATAIRREGGPAGMAFDQAATRLPTAQLLANRSARILAVVAGVRATLVAPYTARSFLDAIADRYEATPALHDIIAAANQAALAGARIGSAVPPDVVADGEGEDVSQLTDRAAELLEVGPHRKLGYQPATRVWQRWIDADDGWLGRILAVVASDHRSQEKPLRTLVDKARNDRWLIKRMNDTDRDERGAEASGIEYHGRDSLLRRTHTHLDLVDDWLELVSADADTQTPDWTQQQAMELYRTVQRRREEALTELGDVGDDELAEAAAGLARHMLDELFARVLEARPYPGREQRPEEVLTRPLLRTDVPLDTRQWQPERLPRFDELDVLAEEPDWVVAFMRRLSREDLSEAAAIIPTVTSLEGEDAAEELRTQLDEATRHAAQSAADLWRTARQELTRAKWEGYLDAAAATTLDQRLDELDITDAGNRRSDQPGVVRTQVGQVLRDLRRFLSHIQRHREERIASRRAEVLRAVRSEDLDPNVTDKALRLIDEGNLVEAEEVIRQANNDLLKPFRLDSLSPVAVADEVADLLNHPAPVDEDLRKAVAEGGRWHGLDFEDLHRQVRARRVHAVEGWLNLRNPVVTGSAVLSAVNSVLAGMGMELPGRAVTLRHRSGGRHRWYDVSDATVRATRAPQFGSMAHGRFRVLVSPESMTVDQAIEVLSDAAGDRQVIHLHLGPWTLDQRQRYAQLLADVPHDVLPIDAAVFAARLAYSEKARGWAVTCGLALPYGATNPYLVDIAGSDLPPEMFFGRSTEQRRLLDPTGPNIVFGGRQLGKTALLRQAEAVFDNYGDHSLAIYVDIRIVGANSDAHRVWNLIIGNSRAVSRKT